MIFFVWGCCRYLAVNRIVSSPHFEGTRKMTTKRPLYLAPMLIGRPTKPLNCQNPSHGVSTGTPWHSVARRGTEKHEMLSFSRIPPSTAGVPLIVVVLWDCMFERTSLDQPHVGNACQSLGIHMSSFYFHVSISSRAKCGSWSPSIALSGLTAFGGEDLWSLVGSFDELGQTKPPRPLTLSPEDGGEGT